MILRHWLIASWLFILASPTEAQVETIPINLDLTQPGFSTSNVLRRSLFWATTSDPIVYGALGIGSFSQPGSVVLPFTVTNAGDYKLVVTYGLTKQMRPFSVAVDGAFPDASWQNVTMWGTTPDYPGGSGAPGEDYSLTDCTSRHLSCWTLSETPVPLTAGSHTIALLFPAGDILVTELKLTAGSTPTNSPTPWILDSYVPFPALDFTDRVTEMVGGNLRITFQGWWQNLAPHPVSFQIGASVTPRKGTNGTVFHITSVQPATTLALTIGQRVPFELTVESTRPVADKYSELVQLNLDSLDVTNLFKPYLMCADNGYLDVRSDVAFDHLSANQILGVRDGTAPESVIPTRASLDFTAGYPRRSLDEAFIFGLANASSPVLSISNGMSINYTAWAQAGAPQNIYDSQGNLWVSWLRDGARDLRNNPLALILDAQGKHRSEGGQELLTTSQLKAMMVLLSQEVPYYPVEGRWDSFAPRILPWIQYDRPGAGALGAYVRLVQEKVMTDAEHFRFLHNVVLPTYVAYRDDLRLFGTLAQPISARQLQTNPAPVIYLARPTAGKVSPVDLIGEWIRIGTGATTEYIRVGRHFDYGQGELEVFEFLPQHDHAAGEPWASFHMREHYELEGLDIHSFLNVALASRDSAVVENIAGTLVLLYSTQALFQEDGSFQNEPGSYGAAAFMYAQQYQKIHAFLGSAVDFPPTFKEQMLKALIMWTEFPFSDGIIPMLNGGGGDSQVTRYGGTASNPLEPLTLELLRKAFPAETNLIARFTRSISQEVNRTPGSFIDNRSFKVDGWGYAMLRGPGPWDARMETLLSSKKLNLDPGDHVSNDALGLCLFTHGTLMTPRYGYLWQGTPALLKNRVTIDDADARSVDPRIWGDFLHFDDHPQLPSAIAFTDMAGIRSTTPGMARQERWVIQLPEYLFDSFFITPRDGQSHTYDWGFRNLGEVAFVSPQVPSASATNDNGTPWEPFEDDYGGGYRYHTGHEGVQYFTSESWQADWTMNEGSATYDAPFGQPPKGARLRLTMAAEPDTKIVTAWMRAPGLPGVEVRQDFVDVRRKGTSASFVDTIEPISFEPLVERVEVMDRTTVGSLAVKVTTREGTDWFLVGSQDYQAASPIRVVGPFNTDAELAMIRVKSGQVSAVMFSGGTSLDFTSAGVTAHFVNGTTNAFHRSLPSLHTIHDQQILPGHSMTQNPALESPLPGMTFRLAFAPSGVVIHPMTGVLTWTPTDVQTPSTNLITIQVTDNESPPVIDTKTIRVQVIALPPLIGYARLNVSTSSGPIPVVLPRRTYQFTPAGSTYYVATNGLDTSSGAIANPWRTFAHALEVLQPGDLLYARAGDYAEPILITQSGLPGKPIIISSFPDEKVRVHQPQGWQAAHLEQATVELRPVAYQTVKYIWIHGLEIEGCRGQAGAPQPSYGQNCISLNVGAGEGCRILNNSCSKAQSSGIWEDRQTMDCLIEGNVVFDNFGNGIDANSTGRTGSIIRGNAVFRHLSGFAINFYGSPTTLVNLYDNLCFDNGYASVFLYGATNVVAHNVCTRAGGGLYFPDGGGQHQTLLNNILFNNVSGQLTGYSLAPSTNNILDYCALFPQSNWADTEWWYTPWVGTHLLFSDPLVFDESSNDFRLGDGSPCRNAAGPVKLLGAYSSPDIGLFPATNYWEPLLSPLSDVSFVQGTSLTFTATLIETNAPTQRVTFALSPDCPQGATIDSLSGVFTWAANESQAVGAYRITVIAMADDSPLVSSSRTFTATVIAKPLRFISSSFGPNGVFQAQLSAIAGRSYIFQSSATLMDWNPVSTNQAASSVLNFADTSAPQSQMRFYRVLLVP